MSWSLQMFWLWFFVVVNSMTLPWQCWNNNYALGCSGIINFSQTPLKHVATMQSSVININGHSRGSQLITQPCWFGLLPLKNSQVLAHNLSDNLATHAGLVQDVTGIDRQTGTSQPCSGCHKHRLPDSMVALTAVFSQHSITSFSQLEHKSIEKTTVSAFFIPFLLKMPMVLFLLGVP